MINQISYYQTYSRNDLKLKLPFGCIISGPSSIGKSTFVKSLILNAKEVIDPIPESILYCYGEYNSLVSDLQRVGVNVYSGAPPEEVIKTQEKSSLIILDDQLYSIDEKYLSELYTKKVPSLEFWNCICRSKPIWKETASCSTKFNVSRFI